MNERSDRLMKALGDIGADLIAKAAPVFPEAPDTSEHGNIIAVTPYEPEIQLTKRDIRIYWITRILGAAAAIAIIGTGVFLLWKNWDKIAAKDPDRPGVVTTVSENDPTPVTDEITYKYNGCTVKVKDYEFDGLTARVTYDLIFDKDPGYDLQPHVSPCIADPNKEFSGKPFKLVNHDGLVYTWETSCTQYEPSDEITLAFVDWSVSAEDNAAMKNDPVYCLTISKGRVPARVIETDKAIPLTAGNVNVKAVYICENTITVKCNPSGLTGDELIELAEADIKIIMIDGYEVQFALEPNTVNPVMETADGYVFTGRFNAGHIDTSMIRSVLINEVLIYNNTSIHDTWSQEYKFSLADGSYSFSDEVFGIFENVFYGEWQPAEGNNADQNIILTYSKDMFTFENWIYPFGILENDDAYVMPYMSGGVPECLIIRKDDPRVLYKGWWNRTDSSDYYTEPTETFTVDPGTGKYKRKNDEPYDRELHTGEIGVWGLHKLICGGEQSAIRPRFETETYYTIPGGFYGGGYSVPGGFEGKGYFTDENGTEWVISGTKALGASKVYYLGGDGITSLTLGIRYYEKAAYETYINEHIDDAAYEPKEQYFAVSFTVDENGICRTTYRPLEEVYEEAKTKTYTGATPDYYEGLLPELELKDVLRVGESLSFQSAVVALRAPDGEIKASCPLASGMVGLSGYSCTAMREPLVQLFNLENRRILIAVGLPLWESEFDRSYLTSFYLYDGDPILRRVEADGDCLEVIVKDSTGISPGEDGTIYCTQPDGLILEYHIGENGHAALSPSQYN